MKEIKKYSQATINQKYGVVKKDIILERENTCENCGKTQFLTPSHTIAQKDCKNYGHPELIWDPKNIVILCVQCHDRWERRDASLAIYPALMAYVKDVTHSLDIEEIYNRYKYIAEWKTQR